MKKNVLCILSLGVVMSLISVGYVKGSLQEAADPPQISISAQKEQDADFGYIDNITFEKIKSKDRITIVLSKKTRVDVEASAGYDVLVKLENTFVRDELRQPLGVGRLSNVINVVVTQRTTGGQQWALVTIALKKQVPYSVSQIGQNVFIDFYVSSLESKQTEAAQAAAEPPKETAKEGAKPSGEVEAEAKRFTGRYISFDFQDANIKAVLRLLAEAGGVTIASGDDVKGTVTLSTKKIPWDEALDTVLDICGLVKKQTSNVITVLSIERMKREQADRRAAEEDRLKAEAIAKKVQQERLEEKGKLSQISIEAKIVEATDSFVRNIGVTWGGVSYNSIGNYSYALTAGTNTSSSSNAVTWGYPTGLPTANTSGTVMQSAAVNMPSAVSGSPTFGLIIGGGNAVLEAQLAALETNNQGKVISSPKVTTMDNVKATIKQGQEIPYVTIDKDGNRSITFKEAVLKLEVKPKITPDGTISMEIKASNDAADYTEASQLGGNPPINKNEVESKIVVHDGDTIVLGGILITNQQSSVTGVPWFMKIPVLGWLFKTESMTKSRKQLMVFITPKIINGEVAAALYSANLHKGPRDLW